jgi:hypothetical protein
MFIHRELPAHSWTKNPPEEWLFRWELPAHRRGIHSRIGIPPGITSSLTLNQDGKMKIAKNPPNGNNSRISNSKPSNYTANVNFKKPLNTKTLLK